MFSGETWHIGVDPAARRALNRFPKKDSERILEVIGAMSCNPYTGDIEKLGGEENKWRRRVGSYRIFYRIYQNTRMVSMWCTLNAAAHIRIEPLLRFRKIAFLRHGGGASGGKDDC